MIIELLHILLVILTTLTLIAAGLYILSLRFVFVELKDAERKRDLIISSSFYVGILLAAIGELLFLVNGAYEALGMAFKVLGFAVFIGAFMMRFKTNLTRFKIYLKR